VVDASFAERRKTIANAVRRLGAARTAAVLDDAGIEASARPDALLFADYVALTRSLVDHGWSA
jgi:16S rRNA A1518/A1519 N6-dimethyltransferase RsmA/KsgA/DIM1 with predicted DNA glycosylase/AP lyase activity